MSDVVFLSIRNWKRYQHYGNVRRPVWIKHYSHLLDDSEDHGLPIATRLLWRQLLLLAAKHENAIPKDYKLIGAQVYLSPRKVEEGVAALLELGWMQEKKRDLFSRKALEKGRRRTGWKFVRGTHGGTYVPAEDGTDIPPYAARNATTRRVA